MAMLNNQRVIQSTNDLTNWLTDDKSWKNVYITMEKTHFVLCLSIFVKQPVLWGIFFFASIYSLMILMFFFCHLLLMV